MTGVQTCALPISENGIEVLDMLNNDEYDLILMDAQMPEMDGLDATRAIRKFEDQKKRNIPIIALTASVHRADIDKCLASGMNDFVPKPFTREELLGSIAQFYHNPNPIENSAKKSDATIEPQNSKVIITAAEAEEESDGVTSLDFLREFTEGDSERMKKYIGLYLKLLPGNIDKIGNAVESKDYEGLVKVIHAMRPHLNYMGMTVTSEWAAEIENSIREDRKEESVLELASQLKLNCEKSKVELEKRLELI